MSNPSAFIGGDIKRSLVVGYASSDVGVYGDMRPAQNLKQHENFHRYQQHRIEKLKHLNYA